MLAWIHTFEFSQGSMSGPAPIRASARLPRRAAPSSLRRRTPMARFAMARAAYLMRDLDVFYAEADVRSPEPA